MKKLFALLLSFLMLFTLTACEEEDVDLALDIAIAVLEELEDEVLNETSVQEPYHCSLSADYYTCPYGICQKIHTHPEYGAVFLDDALTQHVIDKIAAQSKDRYIRSLVEQSHLTAEQAETLFYFQLNGCLAMNKDIYRNKNKDWQECRELISGFIQGGLRRFRK